MIPQSHVETRHGTSLHDTVIMGVIIFKDSVSFGRLFFLGLLVISLIGLKATSS